MPDSAEASAPVLASSAPGLAYLIEGIRKMQGEQYQNEGSQPVYQAEGSQPVLTGTVVQQEPVVLSGTVVGMEQPAPTAHAVQPGKMPVVSAGAPPPTSSSSATGNPGSRRTCGRQPTSPILVFLSPCCW